MHHLRGILLCVTALWALAQTVAAAPAPAYTPAQEKSLAIRAAQLDALSKLADRVLGTRLTADRTVGAALGAGSEGEIALRVFLRTARRVGDIRYYSDGVAEMDIEIPLAGVAQTLERYNVAGPTGKLDLVDIEPHVVDGFLRTSGHGHAPEDVPPAILARVMASRPEDLPELFPAGWDAVTATGRVRAVLAARVRAYQAMADILCSIHLDQTRTIANFIAESPAAEAAIDAFLRGLPVTGAARLMPDRIAEVEVTANVRDLIRVLKEIRALRPADSPWTDEQIDQVSVRLKTDRLTASGCGMPPASETKAVELRSPVRAGPMPDWAATALEARGTANRSDEITEEAEARLLAARSAKARAQVELERLVDAIRLDGDVTVRLRASKDEVFRNDLKTFLSSVRTTKYGPTEDGKGWAVTLELPLLRLYELSRPKD